MSNPAVSPYGTWHSPITTGLIAGSTIGVGAPIYDGVDLLWSEGRPTEDGRVVVVRRTPDGTTEDVTPQPINVRTRVHEYGGAAWTAQGGILYFVSFQDQHLYRRRLDGTVQRLSSVDGMRYADLRIDARRARVIAVREDHTMADREAIATIVSLATDGGDERVLVEGHDFYANPRLSPDGRALCWLAWNHPNMPWDGTALWVAAVQEDGSLASPVKVAGGTAESIFQPEWSPTNVLHFVSDRSNWWNLYRMHEGQVEPLYPMDAEFGMPQWVFGMSTYGFVGPEQILCTYSQAGLWHLALLDQSAGTWTPLDTPYTQFNELTTAPGRALFIGASPALAPAIVEYTVADGRFTIHRASSKVAIDPGYLSEPHPIEFPTTHDRTAHGFYYPPTNTDWTAPEGERPPLLVKSHGGPTSAASSALNLSIQYWTSRGFAVLDVNYGGSTGYGRAYRQRLKDQWGVVDVDDCVNGALYLVAQGLADSRRLCIDGGSAGGYTTLCALTFRGIFAAGASYYGVSDAEALAKDTHKFESRYLDSLIGPYPAARDRYVERSPIHFTHRLSRPIILLQGLEDKVVPPDQAELMYEAVLRKGIPVAYLAFDGEQHGFRKAEHIKRALEAEFYFYSKVFGFTPADAIEPVPIANL